MFFRDHHRTITCYYEKLTGAVCDKYDLTQMEYDILMFLHDNPQYNTAAEIVKIRKSTKSHVSTSLRMLEEKGLIEKRQSEDNKTHIAIILLDKAKTIVMKAQPFRSSSQEIYWTDFPTRKWICARRYLKKFTKMRKNA